MNRKKKKKKLAKATRAEPRRPIASKLIKKLHDFKTAKVIDLRAVREGKKNAEELQKTIATRDDLAHLHPAHACYVYAQHQISVIAEQLTMLPELDRIGRLIGKAEDTYLPSGPPMSPLTRSYFTGWAFFDACVGVGRETLGTTIMAVGKVLGIHEELVRLIGLMQDSRMSIFIHEGTDGDKSVLRELVTNRVYRAICPSGHVGRTGELWYARVLPPPIPELDEYLVFTTPYVVTEPGAREWLAYFDRTLTDRTLADGQRERLLATFERHMKWGPTRDYWNEFVFEAYVGHRHEVIFLEGLPDVAESRPHSRVNY